MSVIPREQVMEELVQQLRDFPDHEYSGEILPDTLFFGDLGFASIDAVVLWERIQEHYQRELSYHGFIHELRQSEVMDIRVGQLAEYLHQQLNATQCES